MVLHGGTINNPGNIPLSWFCSTCQVAPSRLTHCIIRHREADREIERGRERERYSFCSLPEVMMSHRNNCPVTCETMTLLIYYVKPSNQTWTYFTGRDMQTTSYTSSASQPGYSWTPGPTNRLICFWLTASPSRTTSMK